VSFIREATLTLGPERDDHRALSQARVDQNTILHANITDRQASLRVAQGLSYGLSDSEVLRNESHEL
jgi:hypothetical protein